MSVPAEQTAETPVLTGNPLFHCPICATISDCIDTKECPNCFFPLKFGKKIKNIDIAEGTVKKPEEHELEAARQRRVAKHLSKEWMCKWCDYHMMIQGYNIHDNITCPRCLRPLSIWRNGKCIDNKDIASGVIRLTEQDIPLAPKHAKGSGNLIRISAEERIREQNKQSEIKKLKTEVAELKAEAALEKNKKKNLPWFAIGYFGTDVARKMGLLNKNDINEINKNKK